MANNRRGQIPQDDGLAGVLLIFMVVMMVVALTIGFAKGDLKSPSCGGYADYYPTRLGK
ncbi:hypothetical protein ACFL3T_04210 [Patescibacteria group bacterium]